jgi:hypothetical protein
MIRRILIYVTRFARRLVEKEISERLRLELQLAARYATECRKKSLHDNEAFFNILLYLLLAYRDFWVLTMGYDRTHDPCHRGFYLRQFALLIYEITNDLPELLGRDFRERMKRLPDGVNPLSELDPLTKEVNRLRKNNEKNLYLIRNCVSAHRDNDAIRQWEVLREMEGDQLLHLTADLHDLLEQTTTSLFRLAEKLNEGQARLEHSRPNYPFETDAR